MIVVKAAYRNETRKFSFEYNSLPTYYDLQTQLCRVFPLLNFRNFYLSQLLFSPNASQPGHIMIAREVHDLEGYSASTKPHQRYFVNALLKFNVMDKLPLPSDPQSFVTRSPFTTQNVASVDSCSTASPINATSAKSVASTQSLAESIDQMNSSIQDLRKNLDKLTLATLGRSVDPCAICNNPVGGLRYTCRNCDACVCSTCNLKGDYFCIVTSGIHSLNLAVTGPSGTLNAVDCPFDSPRPTVPGSFTHLAGSHCPSSTNACSPSSDRPLGSSSPSMQVDNDTHSTTATSSIPAPPPPPVIHEGIICDGCQNIVEGTRHKYYDMCSRCVIGGGLDTHTTTHEWISLDKPTRVIIHKPNNARSEQAEDAIIHNATCDLCDSVIVGQRYKCTTCPDFDTCKACFSIVGEQHPKHHFVRIDHPSAYIQQRDRPRARHPAFCDVCRNTIYGIRYKCMHAQCPDFDLCEDCEALPIPQHPPSHPFLKIRTSDVVVPTVVHSRSCPANVSRTPCEPFTLYGSVVPPTQMPLPKVKLPLRSPLGSPNTVESNVALESTRPQIPVKEEAFDTPASNNTPLLPPTATEANTEALPAIDPGPVSQAEIQSSDCLNAETETINLSQAMKSINLKVPEPSQPAACASPISGSADATSVVKESTTPILPVAPWDLSRGLNILLQPDIPTETDIKHGGANLARIDAPTAPEVDSAITETDWPNSTVISAEAPALPPLDSLPTLPSNLFAPASDSNVLSTLFDASTHSPVIQNTLLSTGPSEPPATDIATNLSASCLGNVTVPDRQVFPPGSTFVKCWKMINDGDHDWPANTHITFVGGDSFFGEQTATFLTGGAKPGEVRNVWTGELKAPEAPGRYMSYWRLRDGNGTAFGQPIWIDIEVLEPLSRSLEDNLSSSSVVVMPNLEAPAAPLDSPKSTSTNSSIAIGDDDALSDTSFVSVGSSSDDEDADLWTDSRRQLPSTQRQETQGLDYVLLYDDNSSDDEL